MELHLLSCSWQKKKELLWNSFHSETLKDPAWYRAYWTEIIVPGEQRVCRKCKPTRHCPGCGERKPQKDFEESKKHQSQQDAREVICLVCKANRKHCHECQKRKERKGFSSSMLHRARDSNQPTLCLQCKEELAQEQLIRCDICKVDKPLVACWHTPKINRDSKTRTSRCYDCTLPPCSFLDKGCKTRQQCRNPKCRT